MTPVVEAVPTKTATASPAEAPEETLTEVQEFLERTQDYHLTDTSAPIADAQRSQRRAPNDQQRREVEPVGKPGVVAATVHPRPVKEEPPAVVTSTQSAMDVRQDSTPQAAAPVVQSVSIRSQSPVGANVLKPVHRKKATNTPLEIGGEESALSIDRFLDLLKTQADTNGDLGSIWTYRLVRRILGRGDGAAGSGSSFSRESANLYSALVDVMDAVRSLAQDPLSTGEDAVARVSALQELVASRTDPVVETVALCQRVVTYGVIEEMAPSEFVSGRSIPTIVYAEIRNLQSEISADKVHRTVFGTRIEVLTASGQSVWHHEEPEIVDRCRRHRHDFFVAQRITLPPTLGLGDYVLKFLIEDKLSGKMSEAAFDFAISAPDTLTAGR